jgi:hypothetical protein
LQNYGKNYRFNEQLNSQFSVGMNLKCINSGRLRIYFKKNLKNYFDNRNESAYICTPFSKRGKVLCIKIDLKAKWVTALEI